MKNHLDKAREAITLQILNDFKDKITGNSIERVSGHNPEEVYFVGKLMSINDDTGKNSNFSSKTFIESISVDFYINDLQFEEALISVIPKGDFYYRIYPTLQEQRSAMLSNVKKVSGESFDTYRDLLLDYEKDPTKFAKTNIKLIPAYKKVSLEKLGIVLKLKVSEVFDFGLGYGIIDEASEENKCLDEALQNAIQSIIDNDEEFYRYEVKEQTSIVDLTDEDTYRTFIKNNAKTDVSIMVS